MYIICFLCCFCKIIIIHFKTNWHMKNCNNKDSFVCSVAIYQTNKSNFALNITDKFLYFVKIIGFISEVINYIFYIIAHKFGKNMFYFKLCIFLCDIYFVNVSFSFICCNLLFLIFFCFLKILVYWLYLWSKSRLPSSQFLSY